MPARIGPYAGPSPSDPPFERALEILLAHIDDPSLPNRAFIRGEALMELLVHIRGIPDQSLVPPHCPPAVSHLAGRPRLQWGVFDLLECESDLSGDSLWADEAWMVAWQAAARRKTVEIIEGILLSSAVKSAASRSSWYRVIALAWLEERLSDYAIVSTPLEIVEGFLSAPDAQAMARWLVFDLHLSPVSPSRAVASWLAALLSSTGNMTLSAAYSIIPESEVDALVMQRFEDSALAARRRAVADRASSRRAWARLRASGLPASRSLDLLSSACRAYYGCDLLDLDSSVALAAVLVSASRACLDASQRADIVSSGALSFLGDRIRLLETSMLSPDPSPSSPLDISWGHIYVADASLRGPALSSWPSPPDEGVYPEFAERFFDACIEAGYSLGFIRAVASSALYVTPAARPVLLALVDSATRHWPSPET